MPAHTGETVFQLRIRLEEVAPPVWRRLLVPGRVRLGRLHDILQAAMGWTDSHLHDFRIADNLYGMQFDDYPEQELDEQAFTVLQAIGDERRFKYEYDFGDDWQHEVVVEDKLKVPHGIRFAVCLDGQRACPPEDCGGPWGYANFLKAISDPDHEEHDEYVGWVGGYFDSEAFSVAAANAALQHIR